MKLKLAAVARRAAKAATAEQPLFDSDVEETKRSRKIAAQPLPTAFYYIAFTGRSGSSWLCDLMRSAGTLGDPGEAFNPNMVPKVARALAAPDLETYLDRHMRFRQSGGTYGFKATSHHAESLFGPLDAFFERFAGYAPMSLIRQDIVAQAVSSYMMRFQKFGHNIEGKEADQVQDAPYDARILRKIVDRIAAQEAAWDDAFARHGVTPLRLSQEGMLATDPQALIARLAEHIGVTPAAGAAPTSRHKKIGTSLNKTFAERFHEEDAAFVAEIAVARAGRLAALDFART